MLKKEILDTLKQTGIVLSFLLLMPIIFGINQMRFGEEQLSFLWYIDWGMRFLIPALLLYLSFMLFANENLNTATEYLQSLPISKWKLLLMKIAPRLVIILIVLLTYSAIFFHTPDHYIVNAPWSLYSSITRLSPQVYILLIILTSLISGFFLGISDRKNPILIIAFALPILFLILNKVDVPVSFIRKMNYWLYSYFGNKSYNLMWSILRFSHLYLPATLPFFALIPVFKSWDASSGKIRSQRILKRMAAPLTLIIALFTLNQLNVF